ncbi:MAG TPA: ABC transporter permease [Clostridiaceae bacterium]
MKKTLLKDTFKEIKNTLSRFLGILLIVALGTAFFVGIKTTCPDMKLTGDKYYKNQNFMDFRLASTTGFTSADVASIRNIKGIKGVMPSYYLDAFTSFGTRQKAIRVISLPENSSNNNKDYINRPELIKGRLPQKSGECVIETSSIINLTLGSKIKLTLGDDSTLSDKLIKDEFTVVGIVRSPLYISKDRGTTSIGSGQVAAFMEIPESDFNLKYYNNISLTVNIDTSIKAYSKRYDNITSPIMSSLQAFADKKAIDLNKQINVKNQIGNIPSVKWYVFDRTTNSGYVEYGNAADRMDAIAQVFPVLFILVAILICFTSMSRMVEEQRQYMGTLKALGYNSLSIASKFITYAAFASILGGMLGLSIGFTVFPSILNKAYSILYTLPKLELIFDVPFAIISLVVGLLVTTLSALLVCIEELNSNAAYLMRPRSPKPGKVILLEKIKFIWKRLKFTPKVTMRNLFRYKIRFFMTMIGIGGCTALLLVGFGLNDAIRTIGDKQFGEIYTYQMSVNLKDNISLDEKNEIENALKSQSEYSSMENFLSKSLDIGFKNTEKSCNLMVPENIMDLVNYINLRDRITNKSVPLKDDGVILLKRLLKLLV